MEAGKQGITKAKNKRRTMGAKKIRRYFGRTAARATGLLLAIALLVPATQAKKKPPAKPIDLNTATAQQLEKLPGVGPATAAAIIRFREKSGPFRRVEDLLAIRGITKRRLEQIRPYVAVPSTPPAKSH